MDVYQFPIVIAQSLLLSLYLREVSDLQNVEMKQRTDRFYCQQQTSLFFY